MTAADIERFVDLVRPGRRFVLTTHVHPDGDGIGSEIALYRFLAARGVVVRIVNRDATPAMLLFLDPDGWIEVYDAERHDSVLVDADVVVMLDNSDPQRLEQIEAPVRASRAFKVSIDHHPDPDPFWDLLLIRLDACCTGMVVRDLLTAAGAPIDTRSAMALYTALSSDTGRFRFGNTSADAFRMAAELVDAGVSPAMLYGFLSERLSEGFLRLFGALLASVELRADGRIVLLRVPRSVIDRYGAQGEDLAEVINQSLKLESSRVAALFRELAPGVTKVSLRSKGSLDVNLLARRHGGGGHRNASGIVLQCTIDAAVERLAPELDELLGA